MSATLDLITIGDVSLDSFISPSESETFCSIDEKECMVCFKYGDKIPVTSLDFSVGGNAANNAVGARRLGLHVAMVSTFGDDIVGRQIREALSAENLILSYVHEGENMRSNYSTVINYAEERTIFSFHAPKPYVFPKNLPESKWIYLTSLGDGWEEVFEQTLMWLTKHPNVKLAFNPGSRQLRAALVELKPILKRADLLYVNREEAEHLSMKSDSVEHEKELLRAVHETGPSIVVVTDGPAGAYVYNGQSYLYAPIFPQKPISRTGAGDAFGSGCLSALINGKTLEEALLWGTLNSASVIGKVGAQKGLLHLDEMAVWLEKAKEEKIEVHELT